MMKISFSSYKLNFAGRGARPCREGALLRFDFDNGEVGYADCHPWPELGDVALAEQLKLLGTGVHTNLTSQSMIFGILDAHARLNKKNLFSGLSIPESHYLFIEPSPDNDRDILEIPSKGFKYIKIKVGRDPSSEIPILKRWIQSLIPLGCRLRLDFNCKLSSQEFLNYLKQLGNMKEGIDFYEDPCPFDPLAWEHIRKQYGIKLACDRDSYHALHHPASCDVLVIKPAVQKVRSFLSHPLHGRKLVFTSYLDHPLGQLSAAYAAAAAAKERVHDIETCGLLSHHVYEPCPFQRYLTHERATLNAPEGYGFGFDELLGGQSWKPLN